MPYLKARHLLCCLAGATAFGTAPPVSSVAVAQTIHPAPGSRVRVTAPDYDMRQATGRLLRLTADSITIDRDGARPEVTLPVHSVSRLELSTGKRPGLGFVQGAGAGFVIGSLVGIAFGGLQYLSCSTEECALWFLITIPAGAGAGLIVGSIVGAARPPDQWEEVPLTRGSSELRLPGEHRTARIGLSIAF